MPSDGPAALVAVNVPPAQEALGRALGGCVGPVPLDAPNYRNVAYTPRQASDAERNKRGERIHVAFKKQSQWVSEDSLLRGCCVKRAKRLMELHLLKDREGEPWSRLDAGHWQQL